MGTDSSYSTWTSDRSSAGLEVEFKFRIIFIITPLCTSLSIISHCPPENRDKWTKYWKSNNLISSKLVTSHGSEFNETNERTMRHRARLNVNWPLHAKHSPLYSSSVEWRVSAEGCSRRRTEYVVVVSKYILLCCLWGKNELNLVVVLSIVRERGERAKLRNGQEINHRWRSC